MKGRRGRRGQTSPGEERGNETGKVAIAHGSVEFCEATPIGLDMRMRRVTRFIFYFFRTSSALGGGGERGAARLFFFFFFLCSADHERDWPPF